MSRGKRPMRLAGLAHVRAAGLRNGTGQPVSGLPASFVQFFRAASGLAGLDGRECFAVLTPGELAEVLGAIPARSLEGAGDLMAMMRVTDLLNGRESRFTGVRTDDLAAVLSLITAVIPQDTVLDDRERGALKRLRESAGLPVLKPPPAAGNRRQERE